MCGNFNDIKADDLKANGDMDSTAMAHIESVAIEKGCEFAPNKTYLANACEVYPEREPRAADSCEVIYHEPFKACHNVVSMQYDLLEL